MFPVQHHDMPARSLREAEQWWKQESTPSTCLQEDALFANDVCRDDEGTMPAGSVVQQAIDGVSNVLHGDFLFVARHIGWRRSIGILTEPKQRCNHDICLQSLSSCSFMPWERP